MGRGAIVKLLIENRADVNAQNNYDDTPLHYAAKYMDIEILSILLNNGSDVNIENLYNKTPLDLATEKPLDFVTEEQHKQVIKLLKEAGAE